MTESFVKSSGHDDVAVIGLSCRFPGASSPEAYWELLASGREAVGDVPADRAVHIGDRVGRAGLIDGVAHFDAGFFGVSPREAAVMDPRQRLLLELAWEAIERAGIDPSEIRGNQAGVFVGAMGDDYSVLVHDRGDTAVDSFTLSALQRGILANRISFFLGLSGPSMVVDSAQSSALVAIQQACESVRRGECAWALAGGVNLILSPGSTAAAQEFGALSPDGRCYTFDARANGYVRGEGAGLVVLTRLADAIANGNDVLCVIRGGVVNNDGGGEQLTTPSQAAQEQMLRSALSVAGLDPTDVGYVELHGTGTPVGDRVEAAALAAVFADRDQPLLVGSAKTNVGHLEAAAGIVGFIKAALAIQHGQLPAALNFVAPPADVPLAELGIEVVTALREWPGDGPRVAGVSAFGMGGTNCHMLLAQAPDPGPVEARHENASTIPWLVSGATSQAMRAQAERLVDHIAAQIDPDPLDVGLSLITTRAALPFRAAVVGIAVSELIDGLTALAAGKAAPNVVSGAVTDGATAFLFTGQGAQRTGMGRDLYEQFPVFAAALDAICAELDPLLDNGLQETMWSGSGLLDQTRYTQAALFALETALFRLMESFGVRPEYLIGHSIGEVVAAHVAGVLSLPDASTLVAARGRLMQAAPGGGEMVAINCDEASVRALLPASGVGIAAVNGPASVVISGDADRVLAMNQLFRAAKVRTKRLNVSHAFHSHHLDEILDDVTEAIRGLSFRPPEIPIISNLTGRLVSPDQLTDPSYWSDHIRGTVRFADGIRTLHSVGVSRYVELGPDPVLSGMVRKTLAEQKPVVTSTLRSGQNEVRALVKALGALHATGAVVRWSPLFDGGHKIALPTYAFQRRRHWIGETPETEPAPVEELATSCTRDGLRDTVRRHLGAILDYDSVDMTLSFKNLGLTSLTAVELCNGLSDELGVVLSGSLVFDHPTPDRLARHLYRELTGAGHDTSIPTPVSVGGGELVAVVGMGCRFPGGVGSSGQLWDLVWSGRDVVGGLPRDRGWSVEDLFDADPDRTGKSYVDRGYFLDGVGDFDAGFFGISPREALAMDPQQRLLLETVWETLESAGIEPGSLRGSETGVFIGAMAGDYGPRLDTPHGGVDGYMLTGTSGSVLSGRVAYFLGLVGPAVTVDTACSSSLVALHQAAHAVRSGECGLALAGGVTVMSTPGILVEFSRQRGLSADGRCKAFGAAADGTGWGEGAGVVLLERLSDARANGHQVLAVLRGSAVNQDGASNGLTAPNGPSQQRVIAQALANAGLTGADVDVVEGHGTGTRLGDPIEAQALLDTYGKQHSRDQPLWLGSLKSNIGHTMAAAGIGGVIKMVEALRRGMLPPTLHIDQPTPHVDWNSGVQLLTEPREWPPIDRPRRAAVSSFGISGTNTHIILEQAPEADIQPLPPGSLVEEGDPIGWVLSARTEEALREYAGQVSVASAGMSVVDVATTLTSRTVFEHRAVVVGRTREQLLHGLTCVAKGVPSDHVVTGTAGDGKTVLVFPGQGSQWNAMARDLYATAPVFRARLDECAHAISAFVDWDLLRVLLTDDGSRLLTRVDVVQPALFAMMVSLAALWQANGLRPSAVLGHSQGEIAAAYVAGALSLEDAARVVALRSQAIRVLSGRGGMVSIALPVHQVQLQLQPWNDELSIAAINGPSSTVVAGCARTLDQLQSVLDAQGISTRRIPVDYASHSAQVDRIRDRILDLLEPIRPVAGNIDFYSTVMAQRIDGAELDAHYWFRNLRATVEFEATTRLLLGEGYGFFVESSPHPVLVPGLQETIESLSSSARPVATLRRDGGDSTNFLLAVGHAFTTGATTDAFVRHDGHVVPLPTYPFQRDRYWLGPGPGRHEISTAGLTPTDHPLLSAITDGATSTVFTGRISLSTHPWLADHNIAGTIVLPGAAFIELALYAADHVGCPTIRELTVHTPLLLPDQGAHRLRIDIGQPTSHDHARPIRIDARPDTTTDTPWTCHATGWLDNETPSTDWNLTTWPPPGAQPTEISYDTLTTLGYHYGPTFQGLQKIWHHNDLVYAEITLPTDPDTYTIHPALLDTTLHAACTSGPELATSWRGVAVHAVRALDLRVRISPNRTGSLSIRLADAMGDPVAEIGGVATTYTNPRRLQAFSAAQLHALYRETWANHDAKLPESMDSWAIVGVDPLRALEGLTAAGVPVRAYPRLEGLTEMLETLPDYVVFTVPVGGELTAAVRETLCRLQTLLRTEALAAVRAVFLTSSAVAAFGENKVDLVGATVCGLIRSAQAEHPGRFVLVDMDADVASWRVLPHAVLLDEPQIALRSGKIGLRRIAPITATGDSERSVGPAGTVLIIGATTAVGERLAQHLLAVDGTQHLVLASTEVPMLSSGLPTKGATIVSCDPGNRTALRELIADLPAAYPLTMVVYIPKPLSIAETDSLTTDSFADALRATVDAAQILDQEVGAACLVMCSSLAGSLGGNGSAIESASSAALDAIARQRWARGLPSMSLAWGPWEGGDEPPSPRVEGVGVLRAQEAVALFDTACAASESVLIPARLDLAELSKIGTGIAPAIRSLVKTTGKPMASRSTRSTTPLRQKLVAMAEGDRDRALSDLIATHVSAVLGLDSPAVVQPSQAFSELGFDSLSILTLRNRLNSATGLLLDISLMLQRSTPDDLIRHLKQALLEN